MDHANFANNFYKQWYKHVGTFYWLILHICNG